MNTILALTCAEDGEIIEETTSGDKDMRASVEAVEDLLRYRFKNKRLLEEALTHSSYPDFVSYQRLEFVGDAALGLAFTNFVFINYPDLDPGQLSLLRAANIGTEKLARVAVRHGLFRYVRHNATSLEAQVREFAEAVKGEEEEAIYSGSVKAPKVLADIVESIAAAVYVDCAFNLQALWDIFIEVLEPIVALESLQHQPVTVLFELGQKQGKQVVIKHWRRGVKSIASVYADGKFIASGSSDHKEIAKLNAAREALQKLVESNAEDMNVDEGCNLLENGVGEIEGAKQKLNELCGKNRLPKPIYRVEEEVGPPHNRKFICSVQIGTLEGDYIARGDVKSRIKEAESSAASKMLLGIQDAESGAQHL